MILEAVNLDTSGELGLVLVMSTARPVVADDAGIIKPDDFGAITGGPEPRPLLLPPIASKRCTISDIDVRRTPCLRGLSSGMDRFAVVVLVGGVSAFPSPSDVFFAIGKVNIDCGLMREDDAGAASDEEVFVRDACFA